MVSTHLKKNSQNLTQIRLKIKKHWNHHLVFPPHHHICPHLQNTSWRSMRFIFFFKAPGSHFRLMINQNFSLQISAWNISSHGFIPLGSMYGIYLLTFTVKINRSLGKDTSLMDPTRVNYHFKRVYTPPRISWDVSRRSRLIKILKLLKSSTYMHLNIYVIWW